MIHEMHIPDNLPELATKPQLKELAAKGYFLALERGSMGGSDPARTDEGYGLIDDDDLPPNHEFSFDAYGWAPPMNPAVFGATQQAVDEAAKAYETEIDFSFRTAQPLPGSSVVWTEPFYEADDPDELLGDFLDIEIMLPVETGAKSRVYYLQQNEKGQLEGFYTLEPLFEGQEPPTPPGAFMTSHHDGSEGSEGDCGAKFFAMTAEEAAELIKLIDFLLEATHLSYQFEIGEVSSMHPCTSRVFDQRAA